MSSSLFSPLFPSFSPRNRGMEGQHGLRRVIVTIFSWTETLEVQFSGYHLIFPEQVKRSQRFLGRVRQPLHWNSAPNELQNPQFCLLLILFFLFFFLYLVLSLVVFYQLFHFLLFANSGDCLSILDSVAISTLSAEFANIHGLIEDSGGESKCFLQSHFSFLVELF